MPFDLVKIINADHMPEKVSDPNRLKKEAVPYLGQLKQHKSDPKKVYLLIDPLSAGSTLVEFKTKDLLWAEDHSTVTSPDQGSVQLVKIWVKKGSVGLRLTPFLVSDFSEVYREHLG